MDLNKQKEQFIENWCRYPKNDGNKIAMQSDLTALIKGVAEEFWYAGNKKWADTPDMRKQAFEDYWQQLNIE